MKEWTDRKDIPKDIMGIYGLKYDDEIVYVGQSGNIRTRISSHLSKNAVQNQLNAIQKENGNVNRSKQLALYLFIQNLREQNNLEQLHYVILEECETQEELAVKEKYWIEYYKPRFNLKGVVVEYKL